MAWHDRDYNRPDWTQGVMTRAGRLSVNSWLIAICIVVFLVDAVILRVGRIEPPPLDRWGAFSAYAAIDQLQVWRFLSYQFLHAGVFHLFWNMIALYFFGRLVESYLGPARYLAFYLISGIGGALLYFVLLGLGHLAPTAAERIPFLLITNSRTTLVGASGSIFGVMVACAVIAPHQRVSMILPPITLTMRTMVLIWLGLAAFFLMMDPSAGGDAAHLGGAAMGFVLIKNRRLLNFADVSLGRLSRKMAKSWRTRQQNQIRRRIEAEESEVDRILAKVKERGLQSLSEAEKRTLQKATERQRHGE